MPEGMFSYLFRRHIAQLKPDAVFRRQCPALLQQLVPILVDELDHQLVLLGLGMVFSSVRAMLTAMPRLPDSTPPKMPPLPSFSSFSASSGTSSSVRLL